MYNYTQEENAIYQVESRIDNEDTNEVFVEYDGERYVYKTIITLEDDATVKDFIVHRRNKRYTIERLEENKVRYSIKTKLDQ